MPFTTLDQLTPVQVPQNPNAITTDELINGDGSIGRFGALYYYEDILEVVEQLGISKDQLQQIDVRFELNDGNNLDPNGDAVHEITVLAVVTENNVVSRKVALPWAPYYDPESDSGTENFPGAETYIPGIRLTK